MALAHRHDGAVRITTASTSRSDEIRRREVRYLISMGVRTICFILAIVFHGYWRWIFAAGAIILPYIAVVVANAGARPDPASMEPFTVDEHTAIESGPENDAKTKDAPD